MLTLTYAKPEAWQPGHVSGLLKRLRAHFSRQGVSVSGMWVAEMQDQRYRRRGELAIHYHVIVWLPHGVQPPKLDLDGFWDHGMTRRDAVKRSAEGYLMKYATKGSEAPLPKGARIFGVFGLAEFRRQYSYEGRPAWLREVTGVGERLARVSGGGWISFDTGELHRSPWSVVFRDGAVWIMPREDLCPVAT